MSRYLSDEEYDVQCDEREELMREERFDGSDPDPQEHGQDAGFDADE